LIVAEVSSCSVHQALGQCRQLIVVEVQEYQVPQLAKSWEYRQLIVAEAPACQVPQFTKLWGSTCQLIVVEAQLWVRFPSSPSSGAAVS